MLGPCSNAKREASCDALDRRVQHALFEAVVGKLPVITGVRPDLPFVTKCLSYKLAPLRKEHDT